jgi:hypothetical protein
MRKPANIAGFFIIFMLYSILHSTFNEITFLSSNPSDPPNPGSD